MTRYPVCPQCPGCGSARFKTVHEDQMPTLRALRQCKDCGARYEPPLPRWAIFLALVIGAALTAGGAAAACFVPEGMGQIRGILVAVAFCGLSVIALSVQQLRRSKSGSGPSPGGNDTSPADPNPRPSSAGPRADQGP